MNYENEGILIKLKDIRQDLDMTQKSLADNLNVKQGVYSRWENGKEMIPLYRLNELCNLLHYTMDYITGLSVTNKKSNKIHKINLDVCGERLRLWRKSKGITQKQLAEVLNTTQSTISAYEAGQTLILTAFAYQIAKTYHISMDWLVGRSNIQNIQD